jgi:hypothetical protein
VTEVESFLKDKADCGCGCGAYGTLKKPSRDGTRCVARACKCARCRGRVNKRKGQRKQAKAVTALGIPRSSIHPGHEEFLPGALRVEVKAGAQIKPAVTAYLKCEVQSEAARPVGDHRPFVAVFCPDGSSRMFAMFDLGALDDVVAAVVENWEAS